MTIWYDILDMAKVTYSQPDEARQVLTHMADLFYRETGHSVAFSATTNSGTYDPLKGWIWASTDDGFHWQRTYGLDDPLPSPNEIVTELWEDYESWVHQDEINDSQNSD